MDYAHKLVMWYENNMRRLPWRETRDPYAIWVSETMLQQTRVETVIPYYHNFLSSFPTVRELADADEDTVLKHWQGLGYYTRIRNLHKAAKQVVTEFGGAIPQTPELFATLPGVGPYTTGAVMSIAFDRPVPAVDGNVLRVMARFLGLREAIELPSVKKTIHLSVEEWLRESPPCELTQSIMELGATVCTPKSPKCLLCPLQEGCAALRCGLVSELPIRQKRKGRRLVDVLALWCESGGSVLMERRDRDGLLGGMWQLPSVEVPLSETTFPKLDETREQQLMDALRNEVGFSPSNQDPNLQPFVLIGEEKHIFTHIEWRVLVYRPIGMAAENWDAVRRQHPNAEWVKREAVMNLALPRVFEKIASQRLQSDKGVDSHGERAG